MGIRVESRLEKCKTTNFGNLLTPTLLLVMGYLAPEREALEFGLY
jgi:hypothetical protein